MCVRNQDTSADVGVEAAFDHRRKVKAADLHAVLDVHREHQHAAAVEDVSPDGKREKCLWTPDNRHIT